MKDFNQFREDVQDSRERALALRQKQADKERQAQQQSKGSGAGLHQDSDGHVSSASKRHQLAKQGRLQGTKKVEVDEDIQISGNQYNKDVSARQERDKKRSQDHVDSQFYKSDKIERRQMLNRRRAANEAYDPEVQGRSQIRKGGEGGRLYPAKKKSTPERRRVKAVGGGKTAPVEYKDRKDIGKQRARSEREQQPQKERGSKEVAQSYADKVKAERRAKAKARIAAKNSGSHETGVKKTSGKEASKQASKLLSTKTPEKPVSPDYKPQKASGMTRSERMSQQRKGESKLKGIMKQQETDKYKSATGQNPDRKAKTKILGRVAKRMAS